MKPGRPRWPLLPLLLLLRLLLLPEAGRALGEALRPQHPGCATAASGRTKALDRRRQLPAPRGGGPLRAAATAAELDLRARRAGSAVAVSAALGSLLQGFDTGIIGGALLFIVPEFQLAQRPLLQGLMVRRAAGKAREGENLDCLLPDDALSATRRSRTVVCWTGDQLDHGSLGWHIARLQALGRHWYAALRPPPPLQKMPPLR